MLVKRWTSGEASIMERRGEERERGRHSVRVFIHPHHPSPCVQHMNPPLNCSSLPQRSVVFALDAFCTNQQDNDLKGQWLFNGRNFPLNPKPPKFIHDVDSNYASTFSVCWTGVYGHLAMLLLMCAFIDEVKRILLGVHFSKLFKWMN